MFYAVERSYGYKIPERRIAAKQAPSGMAGKDTSAPSAKPDFTRSCRSLLWNPWAAFEIAVALVVAKTHVVIQAGELCIWEV